MISHGQWYSKDNEERLRDVVKTAAGLFPLDLREETVAKLDEIASETNRSRNKLINMLLEYAIDAVEIE